MFLHDCDPPDSTVRVTAVFWSATAFDWASYCISTAQVNAAFLCLYFRGCMFIKVHKSFCLGRAFCYVG